MPPKMLAELKRRSPAFEARVRKLWESSSKEGRAHIANVFENDVPGMLHDLYLWG